MGVVLGMVAFESKETSNLQSNIQHSILLPSIHAFTIVQQVKGNFVIECVLDIIPMFPLHRNVESYDLTMMIGYGQLLIICTKVTMLSSLSVTLKWQSRILKVKLKNPLFEQGHPILNPNLIED